MWIGGAGLRSGRFTRAVAIVAAVTVCALLGGPAASAAPASGGVGPVPAQTAKLPAVQIAVLVDESGSLSPQDVESEKEAATTIAQDVLAEGSTISIVGFGSDNGLAGQNAVDTYCSRLVLDGQQKRDQLASCIGKVHSRSVAEGNGTDHLSALRQAQSLLDTGGDQAKIVFLLTDGKLDVSDSPAYGKGSTPDERNTTARNQIPQLRNELAKINAQVWPLGFGQVPPGALDAFTTGTSCSPQQPAPSARVVENAPDVLRQAVKQALQSATCIQFGDPDAVGTVPSGGELTLSVQIPEIASDALILVFKRSNRLNVVYQGPDGSPVTGSSGPSGSLYEVSGQNTESESLHIVEPRPGKWTVQVTSPPDIPPQEVIATVAYQAAVNASLVVNPPQPSAGQTVDVDMSVQARGATITDADVLRRLTFVTNVKGAGFSPTAPVTLADPDGDGTFTGRIDVPKEANGDLVFTGQVTGLGIGGDTRVVDTSVQSGTDRLQAQINLFPTGASVTSGDTVRGEVAVTNSTGAPVQLAVRTDDATPGVSVDTATLSAPVGSSQVPFAIRVEPPDVPTGAHATIRVVDPTSNRTLAERRFTTDVRPVPGLFERFFWLWVALVAVLAIVVALIIGLVLRERRRTQVRGIRAVLSRNGSVIHDLEPRDPKAREFRFVLQKDYQGRSLQHAARSDGDALVARRSRKGVTLQQPGFSGDPLMRPGDQRPIGPDGDELSVSLADELAAVGRRPHTPSGDPLDGDRFGRGASGPASDAPVGDFSDTASARVPRRRRRNADPFAASYGTAHEDGADGYRDSNNPF